ncbi:HNH endonuclease [Fulvimarina endophytica]|uniref:HNH endonuclease n=1 Tax=Fulvimarina endophytica TaxID=2293836 RepID=UPI0011C0813E|nr:HNH endonuclease [Fulvimarina endophytica]
MKENRPEAPPKVKQQLRQEAGFGCCHCGHPFIQYHHIIPWAEDNHFRPDDMMVLCGQCHHLCTVGAITQSDQRKIKAKPRNIVDDLVRGMLYVNTQNLSVNLAGGKAVETPNLINLSGVTVLSAKRDEEHGRILISAMIHDKSGNVVATLRENEWSMAPNAVWDFETYPLHSKIRLAPYDIAFAVDVRNEELNLQGKWFHKGIEINFSPSKATIGSNVIKSLNAWHCNTMLSVS